MNQCSSFSYAPSPFPFERQGYVIWRRLLGLHDEAVKQHHALLLYAEDHPSNSAML
jgi:hypothetical protein